MLTDHTFYVYNLLESGAPCGRGVNMIGSTLGISHP